MSRAGAGLAQVTQGGGHWPWDLQAPGRSRDGCELGSHGPGETATLAIRTSLLSLPRGQHWGKTSTGLSWGPGRGLLAFDKVNFHRLSTVPGRVAEVDEA